MFSDDILEAQHQEQHLRRRAVIPLLECVDFLQKPCVFLPLGVHFTANVVTSSTENCAVVFAHDGTEFIKKNKKGKECIL